MRAVRGVRAESGCACAVCGAVSRGAACRTCVDVAVGVGSPWGGGVTPRGRWPSGRRWSGRPGVRAAGRRAAALAAVVRRRPRGRRRSGLGRRLDAVPGGDVQEVRLRGRRVRAVRLADVPSCRASACSIRRDAALGLVNPAVDRARVGRRRRRPGRSLLWPTRRVRRPAALRNVEVVQVASSRSARPARPRRRPAG